MRIANQPNDDLSHVAHLIKDIPIGMLTSCTDQGALISRPMSPLEMDADGRFLFFTDMRSSKVEQRDTMNLSFSDVEGGSYVSISGRATVVVDRAQIDRLWTPMAKPWFPDGPDSANLGLLIFTPDAADYWDAPNSKMVRAFSALASIVAGKPIGMGEHGALTDLTGSHLAQESVPGSRG